MVDDGVWPFISEAIQDHPFVLDAAMQEAVALWIMKIAVTARTAYYTRTHTNKEWTDWLYTHRSPLPGWYAWIGRYVGSHPWRYQPHDVCVERGPGSAPLPSGISADHSVYATLVIGYLVMQVFGGNAGGILAGPDEPLLHPVWPLPNAQTAWPPPVYVDDGGLLQLETRLLAEPEQLRPEGPNRAARRTSQRAQNRRS
jgi:hypothetical protein